MKSNVLHVAAILAVLVGGTAVYAQMGQNRVAASGVTASGNR